MAKAAAEAAKALDGGEGPYDGATVAQRLALMRVRNELANKMAVRPESLAPSASVAVTLVAPTTIRAYSDGVLVPIEHDIGGLRVGEAREIRAGRDRLQFAMAGSRLALLFNRV